MSRKNINKNWKYIAAALLSELLRHAAE